MTLPILKPLRKRYSGERVTFQTSKITNDTGPYDEGYIVVEKDFPC